MITKPPIMKYKEKLIYASIFNNNGKPLIKLNKFIGRFVYGFTLKDILPIIRLLRYIRKNRKEIIKAIEEKNKEEAQDGRTDIN